MLGRTCLGLTVALLLASDPAHAQPAGGKPAKPAEPAAVRPALPVAGAVKVSGFEPKSGRAGTRVTITGSGFARGTTVLAGGRKARVLSTSPTRMVVAMPGVPGAADVVLRIPGVANDVVAGSFEVLIDPAIRRLSPVSGAPGTRVLLTGRGFRPGDTFSIGGLILATENVQPDRVTVVIPDGAITDRVAMSRPNGQKARSQVRFRVLSPPPVVGGFSPALGPPGTTVRLNGTGFTAKDRVYYGPVGSSRQLKVLGRGNGWVDVMVGRAARSSQPLTVVGPGGTARSGRPFQLDLPPVVKSFAPRMGAPGTQIDVVGDHFRDGDWVSLAGKRLPIVQIREKQITVRVPPGGQTGPIAVGRSGTIATARGRFEVMNPPSLTSFMPTRGEVGSKVTLHGTHLAGAKVFYGARQLRVLEARGEGAIVVAVPSDARNEPFRVRTRAGETESQRVFQVVAFAVVTDVQPRTVGIGGVLKLSGRHLEKADQFSLGGRVLDIEKRDNRSAIVEVPPGARSGPLEWSSSGRPARTGFPVEVMPPPVVAGFQPHAGPPGTRIIIRGQNFRRDARVTFGKVSLPILARKPGELIALVPKGIGGEQALVVHSGGGRARTDQPFAVRVAPVILAATPSRAYPGSQVLIKGKWFDQATEILVGKMRARVLKRENGSILIEVPPGVAGGVHALVARSGPLATTFRETFLVLGRATPARWERNGWELLGKRVVDGKADRDVIEVGKREGAFTKLMLVVEDSDLELFDLVIEFANGEKVAPKLRHFFKENGRTRALDLPGNKRFIKRITFRYGNLPGGGRARVEVWAMTPKPTPTPMKASK